MGTLSQKIHCQAMPWATAPPMTGGLQPGPWMLAAQHRKLLAQHQDLDLLGLCRPDAQQDQLKDTAQRQVDERPNHADTSADQSEQTTAHRNPS